MTSYPVGETIEYIAAPYTRGVAVENHIGTWTFGDGSTAEGFYTAKTWNAAGPANATVVAYCPNTGTSATAYANVNITEYVYSKSVSAPIYLRSPITATMANGTVLLAGGGATPTKTSYIFNGTSFVAAGNMVYARTNFNGVYDLSGAVLQDGMVWIVGNNSNNAGAASTAELFDPSTSTWSVDTAWVNFITQPYSGSSFRDLNNVSKASKCKPVLLDDGCVFVNGGSTFDGQSSQYGVKYKPGHGLVSVADCSFTVVINGVTQYFTASKLARSIKLPNGDIFVVGMATPGYVGYPSYVMYVVKTSEDTHSDPCPLKDGVLDPWVIGVERRSDLPDFSGLLQNNMSIAIGQDGKVYLFGVQPSNKKSSYSYDPSTDTWARLADAPCDICAGHAFTIGNSIIVTTPSLGSNGGCVTYSIYDAAWIYPRQYVQTGTSVIGNSPSDCGYAFVNGKPMSIGSPSKTTAPYGAAEIFDAF